MGGWRNPAALSLLKFTRRAPIDPPRQKSLVYASILFIMVNATRVEVRRGKNESSASLLRRFSRRAQGLGLVREMRKRRYFARVKSKNVDHKRAMVSLERRDKYHELVKLGKIDPTARRTRGSR